jgi:GxxExxY protein
MFLPEQLMPMKCSLAVRPISQQQFATLDYQVMRHAFDSQNELGRLCDEIIYQNDLAARLDAAELGPIRKEVPIQVTHASFSKTYYLDLVVGDAVIYEFKTAVCLTPEHDAQLLHYLLLHGAHHGKLLNFRPPQVESKFINTGLTPERRNTLEFDTHRWHEAEPVSRTLREIMVGLLEDWGGFLELPLYVEALTHFLGGEGKVVQKVPLFRNGIRLGDQPMYLAGQDIAFRLTAITEAVEPYERQLRSLLQHSALRALQWINLNRHRIDFVTLAK